MMGKLGQNNKRNNSTIRSVILERGDKFYYFKSNLQIVNAISKEDLQSVGIICRNTLWVSFASTANRRNSPCYFTVFAITLSFFWWGFWYQLVHLIKPILNFWSDNTMYWGTAIILPCLILSTCINFCIYIFSSFLV